MIRRPAQRRNATQLVSRRTVIGGLAAASLCPLNAYADEWPSRPVRIICPFAAGGTGDVFARIVAEHFSKVFGQSFYVEARSGAGGQIGSFAAASAPPDGYTLVLSGNASHVLAPAFAPHPQYDGVKDFTHIAHLGGPPVGLLIHPSLPVKDYAEFIAYVRARPEPVSYTSSGIGTHGFVFGEEFAQKEKLRLVHIPYKGGGPAMIDLLSGHVKIATITFSSGAEQVRSGKLKALAISTAKRLPNYPDVPTFAELGHPDMISNSWFALSGPKGMPDDIVRKLNREAAVALEAPEIKRRLFKDAIQIKYMSPEEITAYFAEEIAHWAPLARELRKANAMPR